LSGLLKNIPVPPTGAGDTGGLTTTAGGSTITPGTGVGVGVGVIGAGVGLGATTGTGVGVGTGAGVGVGASVKQDTISVKGGI